MEIAERLRNIRERIRKRLEQPAPPSPELRLPSLGALRELAAAAGRLADEIGSVNPRPPGPANELIQACKRTLARVLGWVVRPQREFNRAVVESLAEVSQLFQETNRNLERLAHAHEVSSRLQQEMAREIDLAVDDNMGRASRLAAEIESWSEASRRAVDSLGEELQEKMKLQRWALEGVLFRIQEELRPLRERLAAQARAQATRLETGAQAPRVAAGSFSAAAVDYAALEHKFRGSEEEIRERQGFYVPLFQDRRNVLDVACGRGEFLELMRQAGVPARGVDVDADMIGRCLEKGLEAVQADVFAYLDTVPDSSLDGIFSAHFVEHLEPAAYAALLQQCVSKLAPSGILAIETPNPECLAIFSQSFFLDPTHVRPIPAAQLRFLFTDAGLARISTHFLSPAGAELPLIPPLASYRIEPDVLKAFNAAVAKFNETFFGGMDYAIIGYKPDSASRST